MAVVAVYDSDYFLKLPISRLDPKNFSTRPKRPPLAGARRPLLGGLGHQRRHDARERHSANVAQRPPRLSGAELWESPQDIHEAIAPKLLGPVLDVGCGECRLASLLDRRISWIGLDASPA